MAIPTPCWNYQRLAGKDKDFGLTPAEIRPIWEYARKRYLDNGVSFEETINNLTKESGLPARFFEEVFVGAKSARGLKTAEMLAAEDRRLAAQHAARLAIEHSDQWLVTKALRFAANFPRAALTPFHSGVYPVTHAGALLSRPSEWATFVKGWWTTWHSLSDAAYMKARLDLYTDPNYAIYRQGGLRIGVDERAQGILAGWMSNTPGWNRKAWMGLLQMRKNLMDQMMRGYKFANEEDKLAMIRELAPIANHATGVVGGSGAGVWGRWLARGQFSPQLTASKIARITVDPARTIATGFKLITRQPTTAGEVAAMKWRLRNMTEYFATRGAVLYLADQLLQHSGSQQRINFKNPGKADWGRLKTGTGLIIADRGLEDMLRIYGQMIAIGYADPRQLHGKSVWDQEMNVLTRFAEYKMEPGIQTAGELITGEDIFGRPIPRGLQLGRYIGMPERIGTVSKPAYTYPEYFWSHSPLWINGAAADVYEEAREKGLSKEDNHILANGAMASFLEFLGFGARYERETQPQPTRHKKYRGSVQ